MKDKRIKQLEKGIIDLQHQIEHIKGESKFEPNKWYKCEYGAIGFYISESERYGFTNEGYWSTTFTMFNASIDLWILATDKEVEEALIKEAKRRGFKGLYHRKEYNDYWTKRDGEGGQLAFMDGVWQNPIEPKVTINGEIMKQEGDVISFGCAKFIADQIQCIEMHIADFNTGYSKSNRKIKSITLDSDVTITIEELKLIVDNIK